MRNIIHVALALLVVSSGCLAAQGTPVGERCIVSFDTDQNPQFFDITQTITENNKLLIYYNTDIYLSEVYTKIKKKKINTSDTVDPGKRLLSVHADEIGGNGTVTLQATGPDKKVVATYRISLENCFSNRVR